MSAIHARRERQASLAAKDSQEKSKQMKRFLMYCLWPFLENLVSDELDRELDISSVLNTGTGLLQIVSIVVYVAEFVDDDLFIDLLDISSCEPVDELSSFLLPFIRGRLVFRFDLLLVGFSRVFVPCEEDPVS